jgi:hypothetical protein
MKVSTFLFYFQEMSYDIMGFMDKNQPCHYRQTRFGAQLPTKMPLATWKETQETHLKRWRYQLQVYRSSRHFKVYFRRSRATDPLKLGGLLQSNTVKT